MDNYELKLGIGRVSTIDMKYLKELDDITENVYFVNNNNYETIDVFVGYILHKSYDYMSIPISVSELRELLNVSRDVNMINETCEKIKSLVECSFSEYGVHILPP